MSVSGSDLGGPSERLSLKRGMSNYFRDPNWGLVLACHIVNVLWEPFEVIFMLFAVHQLHRASGLSALISFSVLFAIFLMILTFSVHVWAIRSFLRSEATEPSRVFFANLILLVSNAALGTFVFTMSLDLSRFVVGSVECLENLSSGGCHVARAVPVQSWAVTAGIALYILHDIYVLFSSCILRYDISRRTFRKPFEVAPSKLNNDKIFTDLENIKNERKSDNDPKTQIPRDEEASASKEKRDSADTNKSSVQAD